MGQAGARYRPQFKSTQHKKAYLAAPEDEAHDSHATAEEGRVSSWSGAKMWVRRNKQIMQRHGGCAGVPWAAADQGGEAGRLLGHRSHQQAVGVARPRCDGLGLGVELE